ncbi:MAG: efflux RND transporter periplasmic adaptor subunit [Spirochaetales bacterium]|uniref:Efflux RND transporter periplasmic adaptor subunit n=1 Tax=Candidatus Thalassospirochaeta sargassi TaxID=3119039 RepID=A0AAJ1MJI5_9SPIO|nr:efflux RND transporter periplasmic adaptor subunit [Spirochaetales bacterium]
MTEKEKDKRSKLTGIILIVLIVLAAAAIAFNVIVKDETQVGAPPGPGRRPGGAEGSDEPATYSVLVETMTPSIMENYLKFNGDVIAKTSVDIYPDTSGKLTKLSVELGDWVSKGQVIAEVDPSLPGQVYSANPVKSTIDGTITNIPHKVGETISSTEVPVATVGELTDLQLDCYISEKYMANIKLGQRAEISFEPYEDQIFSGLVVEISPVLDSSSRTLEIKISLGNRDNLIKSGMFGSIKLITETKEDVLTVPAESLLEGDIGPFVYIVGSDNTAILTNVETGLELDGRVEVTSGLSPGDKVITRGQSMLQNGSTVKIANQE